MFILISLFVLVLCFLLKKWRELQIMDKTVGNLFTFPSKPIIGHFHLLAARNPKEVLENIKKLTFEVDETFKLWIGPWMIIFVQEKDDIKAAVQSISKPIFYRCAADVCSDSIAFIKDENAWQFHRKQLNEAFKPNALKSYVPIFNRTAKKLVNIVAGKVNAGVFDMYPLVFAGTADATAETIFDSDLDLQHGQMQMIREMVIEIQDICIERLLNPIYLVNFIWTRSAKGREAARKQAAFIDILQKGRSAVEFIRILHPEKSTQNPPKFIHKLLNIHDDDMMTTKGVNDNIILFMVAAIETSSFTVSMAVLMLAMHPDVQEKIYNEVKSIVDNSDGNLTYDDIPKLTYTDMVLKETLRLFPSIPITARSVKEPTKLKNGVMLPGTTCVFPIYKIHRNTKIWGADAHLFDPERFTPDKYNDAHQNYFMPFMHGGRNCIGNRYAMLSMKVTLYHLVLNHSFYTDMKLDELKLVFAFSMNLLSKYEITVRAR